jgi:hypothetical protein
MSRKRRIKAGNLADLQRALWQTIIEVEALLDTRPPDTNLVLRAAHALAQLASAYRGILEIDVEARLLALEQAQAEAVGRKGTATMPHYKTRLRRLEARLVRPVSHFVSIIYYPWHLGEPDDDWLQGLVCPCGRQGCPQFRIGAIIPEKALRPEAWAERAAQCCEEQRYA